jgi:hypothetical protein
MRYALALAALSLFGCNSRIQTTGASAPHNPEATRTWWVVRDTSGDDHVILCDTELLRVRGTLCVRWP